MSGAICAASGGTLRDGSLASPPPRFDSLIWNQPNRTRRSRAGELAREPSRPCSVPRSRPKSLQSYCADAGRRPAVLGILKYLHVRCGACAPAATARRPLATLCNDFSLYLTLHGGARHPHGPKCPLRCLRASGQRQRSARYALKRFFPVAESERASGGARLPHVPNRTLRSLRAGGHRQAPARYALQRFLPAAESERAPGGARNPRVPICALPCLRAGGHRPAPACYGVPSQRGLEAIGPNIRPIALI